MRIDALKTELELTILSLNQHIAGFNGSDNPVIIRVRDETIAARDALNAVLNRICGDRLAFTRYYYGDKS